MKVKYLLEAVFAIMLVAGIGFSACSSDDDPSDLGNAYIEYVDLGLSVKWATCNLGASSPEEYGDYYAWGETAPRKDSSLVYEWDTAPYYLSGDSYKNVKWTKYTSSDGKTVLDPADDAATVALGSPWRMPTLDEVKELLKKCKWTWTTMNGKNGYKVVGPNGNSIFLPEAGWRGGSSLTGTGARGDYWSISLHTDYPYYAYGLYFYSTGHDSYNFRYIGRSVRPVRSAGQSMTEVSIADEDDVYQVVEQMPEFPGGLDALSRYLAANLKYPAISQENGVEGTVEVSFVVGRDGTATDFKVVKSVDPALDKEAVRVLRGMPKWMPGKQKGMPVRVRYTVPVDFRLNK